jgi:hypothetical protein
MTIAAGAGYRLPRLLQNQYRVGLAMSGRVVKGRFINPIKGV